MLKVWFLNVIRLEAANMQLRLQLNVGYQHDLSDENFMKSQIAGKLNKLLREGAGEEEIRAAVKGMQEKYSGELL